LNFSFSKNVKRANCRRCKSRWVEVHTQPGARYSLCIGVFEKLNLFLLLEPIYTTALKMLLHEVEVTQNYHPTSFAKVNSKYLIHTV